jgi:hypothetical protein
VSRSPESLSNDALDMGPNLACKAWPNQNFQNKDQIKERLTNEKKIKKCLRADGTERIWLWRRILNEQSKRDSEMGDTGSISNVGNYTPLRVLLCRWIEFGAVQKRADSFGLSQARLNHSIELLLVKLEIFCSYSIDFPFGCIFDEDDEDWELWLET